MVCGALGPGLHTLDPSRLPFLANVASAAGIDADVVFVSTATFHVPVEVSLGTVLDGASQELVSPSITAQAAAQVTNPAVLLGALAGATDEGALRALVQATVTRAIKPVATRRFDDGASVLALVAGDGMAEIAAQTRAALARDEGALGLRLVALDALVCRLSDVDRAALERSAAQLGHARAASGASASTSADDFDNVLAAAARLRAESQRQMAAAAGPRPGAPPARAATGPGDLVGAPVLVTWQDGRVYPAVVRGVQNGTCEVAWEEGGAIAWVPLAQVRRR